MADESGEVAAALDGGNAGEGPAESSADRRFGVRRIGQANPGTDAAIPARNQAASVFPSRAEAGEPERAGDVTRGRVRPGGVEVGVLVLLVCRRQRNVVADAEVEDELTRDAPIILHVEAEVGIILSHFAWRFRAAQMCLTEQETGERTAAGEPDRPRNAGSQKIEIGASGNVLLSNAVGRLILVLEAKLIRVRTAHITQVVLDAPARLQRAVVGRRTPGSVFGEVDRREVIVAVYDVFDADLVLPALAHIGGEAVLDETVEGEREMIDHRRGNGPVVAPAKCFGVPGLDGAVPERFGQAGRARRAGFIAVGREVPQEGDAVIGAEVLVGLHAPFVGWSDKRPTGDDVVLADITAGPGSEAPIRRDALRKRGDLTGGAGKHAHRNLVVREWIANETNAVRIRPRRRWIIDRQQRAVLGYPIAEVAIVHFRRGDGEDGIVGTDAVPEAFEGHEEKGLVPAVVYFRDDDGTGGGEAEIVLAIDGSGSGEEAAGVEFVVAQEVIGGSMKGVGAGLGGESHDAAAGLAVLGLEAVGVNGELRQGFDGGGVEGGFGGVAGAVRPHRIAVERRVPLRRLAAPEGERLPAAFRFGGDGDQVKRTAHGTGDNERQLVDELVFNERCHFGVFGLDGRGGGGDFDGVRHLPELERGVDAHGAAGGDHKILLEEPLETGRDDFDPISARQEVGQVVFAGVCG